MVGSADIKNLIPHQSPMRMIDLIVEFDDAAKTAVLEYTVAADSPFLNNRELDPESLLEIIAQAAAAQHGFNLKRAGKEKEKGFLVGSRDFVIYGKAFAGDKLTINVACGTEIESVSAVRGEIYNNGRQICSANIMVWHN